MPESVSTVDAILDGLRGKAVPTIDEYTAEPDQPHVPLSDAVAAVHAAADARFPLPRTDDRAYDLRQRLNRAVRWLRDAEDIARIEMPAWPTADRIRAIYEQITDDVLNGRVNAPTAAEAAADARTQEIVKELKGKAGTDAVASGTAGFYGASYDRAFGSLAARSAAEFVARRFPNGGTHDG